MLIIFLELAIGTLSPFTDPLLRNDCGSKECVTMAFLVDEALAGLDLDFIGL